MFLVAKVKLALRIVGTDFDDEIMDLCNACLLDLGLAGVDYVDQTDPLIIRAVVTYCKLHFGKPISYNDSRITNGLKESYDEQKAQLSMSSNYTNWVIDPQPEEEVNP